MMTKKRTILLALTLAVSCMLTPQRAEACNISCGVGSLAAIIGGIATIAHYKAENKILESKIKQLFPLTQKLKKLQAKEKLTPQDEHNIAQIIDRLKGIMEQDQLLSTVFADLHHQLQHKQEKNTYGTITGYALTTIGVLLACCCCYYAYSRKKNKSSQPSVHSLANKAGN